MLHRTQFEIRMGRSRVVLGRRTLIMGVVNVTPDSFSDGGLYLEPQHAVAQALNLVREGADWIDVGGESTRPGAKPVPVEEELRRVLPVIREVQRKLPAVPISIDTIKAAVAEKAMRAGAAIINDISGLRYDRQIAEVARRYKAPLILMHMRGRPETMQQKPFAKTIWQSLRSGLQRSIRRALVAGVSRSQLIIDPGLGFGKTRRQNFQILARLDRLREFRVPMLVGTSRKSFVQAVAAEEGLDIPRARKGRRTMWPLSAKRSGDGPPELMGADAAMVTASILAGAHIVRVHDVRAVMPAVRIADALIEAAKNAR